MHTLSIADRSFITSQVLSSIGEIFGMLALDDCGPWMLAPSPGFGRAGRAFLIDSAEQRHWVTGRLKRQLR